MITIDPDILLAFQRFIFSLILFSCVIVLSFWQRLKINNVILVSALRGLIQILLLASVIALVFTLQNFLYLFILLFVMVIFGAHTAAGRVSEIPDVFKLLLVSLTVGIFSVMIATVILQVLPLQGEYIIPIGGMVTGNAMIIWYLTLNRITGEL